LVAQINALRATHPPSPRNAGGLHSSTSNLFRVEIRTNIRYFEATFNYILVLRTRTILEMSSSDSKTTNGLLSISRVDSPPKPVEDQQSSSPTELPSPKSVVGNAEDEDGDAPETVKKDNVAVPSASVTITPSSSDSSIAASASASASETGVSASLPMISLPISSKAKGKGPDDEEDDDDRDEEDGESLEETGIEKRNLRSDDFSATIGASNDSKKGEQSEGEETEEDFTFSDDVSISDLQKMAAASLSKQKIPTDSVSPRGVPSFPSPRPTSPPTPAPVSAQPCSPPSTPSLSLPSPSSPSPSPPPSPSSSSSPSISYSLPSTIPPPSPSSIRNDPRNLRGRASSFVTTQKHVNDTITSPPSPRSRSRRDSITTNDVSKSERKAENKKIKLMKDATILDLSRRDLQSIPSAVCKNRKLVVLNLYSNALKVLPNEIGKRRNREYFFFFISVSYFSFSFSSLGKLTQLTQLGLNENLLSELPKEIGTLKALEILDLRFNRLKRLPPEIQGCVGLKKLFLRFNKLTDLPPTIGKLQALELLSFRNNSITTLPDSFVELRSLKVLDAHQNTLKSLPSFANLTELVEVNLQCNQLTSLPRDFDALGKLQRLHLGYNKFASFPVEIGKVSSPHLSCILLLPLPSFSCFLHSF
jgi:Leucine-rich repeat (LRR) protein